MLRSAVEAILSLCYRSDPVPNYECIKNDFTVCDDDVLGEGQHGVVKKCVCKKTGREYGCKATLNREAAQREISFLRRLSGHPRILDLVSSYEDEQFIYIITEFCNGGDLRNVIDQKGFRSEREAAKIIKSVVEAIEYAHANNIVHGDVKSENILLSWDLNNRNSIPSWNVKLADFDHAEEYKEGEMICNDRVGSLYYAAPEKLSGSYSKEADIWSAGVVLYFILCGQLPFDGDSIYRVCRKIQRTSPNVTSSRWKNVSSSAKDLVVGMLEKNPHQRLSAQQILNHPWIVSMNDTEKWQSMNHFTLRY